MKAVAPYCRAPTFCWWWGPRDTPRWPEPRLLGATPCRPARAKGARAQAKLPRRQQRQQRQQPRRMRLLWQIFAASSRHSESCTRDWSQQSSPARRQKKQSPTKTAWSKGVGFGGSGNTITSQDSRVKKATARQEQTDEQLEKALTALCAALPTEASPPEHHLAVQHALHTSSLSAVLAIILRNDSLLDITSSRAGLYTVAADVVTALAARPQMIGILEDGCPVREAIMAASDDLVSGSKRKADAAGSAEEPGSSTSVFELLKNMGRQCKIFMRQCKSGSAKSAGADPLGVVPRLQKLPDDIQTAMNALPPHLRGTMGRKTPSFAMQTADTTTEAGPAIVESPEEQEYLQSMKAIQFRMVRMDHHGHIYARDIQSSQMACTKRERIRRITREMASLSSSLPLNFTSSIFVRVDEERPDVLKALIIGPEGTPYANGCFAFDIFLPPEYPELPPRVTLLTTSLGRVRFNPNLYANGKVCLSLLGTWDGPGWDAKTSTLLQVFLSIQSLILVDEPYFNEPGFESRPHAKKECAEYNQAIQYQTMAVAMLEMLRDGPPEFAAVVQTHFRLKRANIIAQCKEWQAKSQNRAATKPRAGWSFGGAGQHHQLTFKNRSDFDRIVSDVTTYLDTLEVEDSITLF
mmetsp:Transcript_19935/g.59612  ORF Transcript_19935/g.59612 Transcript_19935/m.59612 type:complete len:636 (-) Transcript_19935:63-1970(-)